MKHLLLLTIFFLPAHVLGDVVSYEGDSFPDDVGWDRGNPTRRADRWLEDGWLVQHADGATPDPPYVGEADGYRRSIAEFAGVDAFFVEWRVETNGASEDMVAPAHLGVGGGAAYQFIVARDRVVFFGLFDLKTHLDVWADIEPGVPHVYRLETYADSWYEWSIDGVVIESGDPEWAFPTSESGIGWGTFAGVEDSTTRWDYIRYGTIPEPATGFLMFGLALVLLHRRTP